MSAFRQLLGLTDVHVGHEIRLLRPVDGHNSAQDTTGPLSLGACRWLLSAGLEASHFEAGPRLAHEFLPLATDITHTAQHEGVALVHFVGDL